MTTCYICGYNAGSTTCSALHAHPHALTPLHSDMADAVKLLRDMEYGHRNAAHAQYNECDRDTPCDWCTKAREIIRKHGPKQSHKGNQP